MTVRKDVLSFLRDPLRFSEGVDEPSRKMWLSALEDFALPLSIESGRRLGPVQEEAWRTLSAYRLGLILGPPGTGKTFALSWMAVSYLLARRKAGLPCRILLTGFTINSIGNLLAGTEEKVRSHQLTGFQSIFCGTSSEEAFPDGVETFQIGDSEDRDSVWERLREPYVIAGLTTWSLYRLLSESDEDGRDGPTLPLFDLICIDEASQMMVAQGLMALAGLRTEGRVLVAGDNQQLPPVQAMFDREINGRQLGSSLYEFLKTAQAPEVRFEETRRMNRPLAAFGSREFYEDRFYPAADIAEEQLQLSATWKDNLNPWERIVLDPAYPVVILLHDGPAAGVENPFERAIVTEVVRLFYERMLPAPGQAELSPETFWRERLAVITPHRAQNAALRASFAKKPWGSGCVVETVDRIQGKERDAIVASYTVADAEFAQAEGDFLFSRNRLNVTTSRARRKLVFIVSRRLFEVVPPREEVIDAAQTLRRFVFGAERVEGQVQFADAEGRYWPAEIRIRRFEQEALPPALEITTQLPQATEVPEFTVALEDLDRIIRQIALENGDYGNAPHWKINQRALREVPFSELVDLLLLGRITLSQVGSPPFWLAKPLDPPRPPHSLDPSRVKQRLLALVDEMGQGKGRVPYWILRNRFAWVTPAQKDALRPFVEELVTEGALQWVGESFLALGTEAEEAEAAELPSVPELTDQDFTLLNLLEEHEKRRINFGIFESWSTLRMLGAELGWDKQSLAESAERLRLNGYLLMGEDDACRSRMAELAREVRYVKQRFKSDDAHQRPYLVRSLKLATRDRNKPARDQKFPALVDRIKALAPTVAHAGAAMDFVRQMVERAWGISDPAIAGFQERSIEEIFLSWIGRSEEDAFVITADTGSGKTEAACLPIIAGAAWDHLCGTRGVRAVFIYPRIRLAHNQAQRVANYFSHFMDVPGAPPLTLGLQTSGVPGTFEGKFKPDWEVRGGGFAFPFFDCPRCGKVLILGPGQGREGADLLTCGSCSWSFAGWIGTQKGLAVSPPSVLLIVTESLHGWMQEPKYSLIFGDNGAPPRAVLADEIHLYSLTHGANVGYAIRRLLARAHINSGGGRPPIAIGMSATLGRPEQVWGNLCGRANVTQLAPTELERAPNVKGREYFYFVQPEVESRGKDIAGASTTIQSLMALAHGMRRRTGKEGGFRALVFLDSIDKVRRLHGDYRDAEEYKALAKFRTHLYGDDPGTGEPRTECCGQPASCARFRDGECWYFAANDPRQIAARGRYEKNKHLSVGRWPVTSRGSDKTAEMMRKSDIIFSTSSLEVGYDDPDMNLVYQHYAPVNLASFVQRKGRGGRGADDRPLTGVTLSPYSPRDSWYFRRPELMLDAAGFEIPLNMDNYFVRRGQAIAALLDGLSRWKSRNQGRSPLDSSLAPAVLARQAAADADQFIREVLGDGIYQELEIRGVDELWSNSYAVRSEELDLRRPPRDWGKSFPWMPRLLFQTINLPVLSVFTAGKGEPDQEDISLALATAAPGNMTRRYSFEDFHWIVPQDGRAPWFSGPECVLREEELLYGKDVASFEREIPNAVRDGLKGPFHLKLSRPTSISMQTAGDRHGDWVPHWAYDRAQHRVVELGENQPQLLRIQEKSQASLRGFMVVSSDQERATNHHWSLAQELGKLCSYVAGKGQSGNPGLRASRLFWASDITLKLEDRNQPEEPLTQFFVHPETRIPMFTGYSLETEGVQLQLDSDALDRFVASEMGRLAGAEEERWLKGRLFRYLLSTKCAAAGLNAYHAVRLSELLQSAASKSDLRPELSRLMKMWDGTRLAGLLRRTFDEVLQYHPLLTRKRIDNLGEAVSGNAYRQVVQSSFRESSDPEVFKRYLRSLVINGVAVRLSQMFVLYGRGDDGHVLAHTKVPMEFGNDASDTISVFENGMHGDGTTRTFLRHFEDVAALWRGGALAECPSAQEDALLDQVAGRQDKHAEWRSLDPNRLADMQQLASDLNVDSNHAPLDRVISMLFGSELVGSARFDLFDLHQEVRAVRSGLRQEVGRVPTVWELVSAATQRAATKAPETPRLAALYDAYASLRDASQEESFSPAARVADQVYRLSASLCVDGCQACVHAAGGADEIPGTDAAVSRLVLADYAEFVFPSA